MIGNRVVRVEDPRLMTHGGTYVADVRHPLLAGAAHVVYVRSTVAHGALVGVDLDAARAMPGVVAVLAAADIGLTPTPSPFNPAFTESPLAIDRVRYVGQPVVAVVAETREQAVDAAEAVVVDVDPLPAVVGVDAALRGDVLLYPDAGSNVVVDGTWMGIPAPDPTLFDGCEVVVNARFVNQRLAPCPLEVRSAASAWGPDGRLHHWASSQLPQTVRDVLALIHGGADRVHVIVPDVGGGFGPRSGLYPEEVLLGSLAGAVGRPLRWTETRTESMLGLAHGRAQLHDVTIGGTRDGRVTAYRLDVVQDAGGVPGFGAVLPVILTRPMAQGVYDIARVECSVRSVVTTTTPTSGYRGAGRPEATAAIERAMDLFAAELDLDPVDLRRRNLLPPFTAPITTALGARYDSGDYAGALDAVLAHVDLAALRSEQRARRERADTRVLGIGVSTYVEITGASVPGSEPAEVAGMTVRADGTVQVRTGTSPHGQGHDTSWAMITADELGVAMDRVEVVHGDTDVVPVGGGTFGSRSTQQGGAAVQRAGTELVAMARALAAELLEASVDDVVLDRDAGWLHVAGSPASGFTWAELATRADAAGTPLVVETRFVAEGPTFPFGAHVAVVEVDLETGAVDLVRHVACDDAGHILNPVVAEGQVHGGIAQGAAQALWEAVVHDDDGNPLTANLADYPCPSAAELPRFEVVPHETPTPFNPLGAKGIGESGTIGATPAVQSAVVDALAHLGVRHLDMPATPERVWQAIREAAAALV
jgi:aerobic carbon-monoxide dehydrogenase large subunit